MRKIFEKSVYINPRSGGSFYFTTIEKFKNVCLFLATISKKFTIYKKKYLGTYVSAK